MHSHLLHRRSCGQALRCSLHHEGAHLALARSLRDARYKIADLDTVELRAYVTEPQLSEVKIGNGVDVTVDVNGSRRTVPGVVSWVSSQAEFTPTPIETRDERTNLVYAIKVRVGNHDGVLKIGMPADVRFRTITASR